MQAEAKVMERLPPRLAPGGAAGSGVLMGVDRPCDAWKGQSPLETPEYERNSGFCSSLPGRTRLEDELEHSHLHVGGEAPGTIDLQEARHLSPPGVLNSSGAKLPESVASSIVAELPDSAGIAGRRFLDLGGPLYESLQKYVWHRHSKTLFTASDSIFPLPLGDYPGVPQDQAHWVRAVLLGLNSLAGVVGAQTVTPNEVQKRLVAELLRFLGMMCSWQERVPSTGFSELFDVKGVD